VLEIEKNPLFDRYPELAFFYSSDFVPFHLVQEANGFLNAKRLNKNKEQFLHTPEKISQEIEEWKKHLNLNDVEVLVVYGLGLGYYFEAVKSWLEEKRERVLIFLEDDPAVFDVFSKVPLAKPLLKHAQVHIRFIPQEAPLEPHVEELVHCFPTERIEVVALKSYKEASPKKFQKIRLKILREATAFCALLSDVLHTDRLFANLLPNFYRLPEASFANQWRGQFKDIPAVICGAGPSLTQCIPLLKTLNNKALIFAGGSTFSALSQQGVVPHFGMALDPNPDEYSRIVLNSAFEAPFIYGNRVLPTIFHCFNGPLCYLRSETGGACERWMDEQLRLSQEEPIGPDLDKEAFSVTTLALSFACALGCNPIIFAGVDLAYTGLKRYAEGVLHDNKVSLKSLMNTKKASEKLVRRKNRKGVWVHTLIKWVMESHAISAFADTHDDRTFITISEGLGFKGIYYMQPNQIANHYCLKTYDLNNQIHELISHSKMQTSKNQVLKSISLLKESLYKCKIYCEEALQLLSQNQESGKLTLIEMDFQEEIAYRCLLESLGPALNLLFQRKNSLSQDLQPEELSKISSQLLKAKWDHYLTVIQKLISLI